MYSDQGSLVEPTVIHDIFVSGLARIEVAGGDNIRYTFYTLQKSTMYSDERLERVVVARIVIPISVARDAAQATILALADIGGVIRDIVVERARH